MYQVNETQLKALDALEQNGIRYQREVVKLQGAGDAWLYVLIANEEPTKEQQLIKTNNNIQEWVRGLAL